MLGCGAWACHDVRYWGSYMNSPGAYVFPAQHGSLAARLGEVCQEDLGAGRAYLVPKPTTKFVKTSTSRKKLDLP